METIKFVNGDLLDMLDQFDVVLHGSNCFHTMGAGIAKQLKDRYPQVYEADLNTAYGDEGKLGTYSKASVGNTDVLNCYTQKEYNSDGRPFDYDAFAQCLDTVLVEYAGKKIGMPKIGAGLAGGDWIVIESIIRDKLDGEDVTVVEYLPQITPEK